MVASLPLKGHIRKARKFLNLSFYATYLNLLIWHCDKKTEEVVGSVCVFCARSRRIRMTGRASKGRSLVYGTMGLGRSSIFAWGVRHSPYLLPSLPLSLPLLAFFPLPFPPFCSFPNPARVWESAENSPRGVRGGVPAANEF